MSGVRLLGIPIDSAGGAIGTTFMPSVLREHGVVDAIGADDVGDLEVLIDPPSRDPGTGIVGSDSVLDVTRTIRSAVATLAQEGTTLVLLGGCCALAVGAIAGVRDTMGDVGVVYLDGHLDLYDGENSPSGEAADMPLAVALGVGPPAWGEVVGAPLVAAEDVALVGFRDLDEARAFGSVTPADLPGLTAIDTPRIRELGAAVAAADALAGVRAGDRPFFAFVDLDILDEAVFPNDAPVAEGLDWGELTALLGPIVRHPACLGLAVACYNPDRDPARTSARHIVDLLRDVVPNHRS